MLLVHLQAADSGLWCPGIVPAAFLRLRGLKNLSTECNLILQVSFLVAAGDCTDCAFLNSIRNRPCCVFYHVYEKWGILGYKVEFGDGIFNSLNSMNSMNSC